jgi:hypothetical protein
MQHIPFVLFLELTMIIFKKSQTLRSKLRKKEAEMRRVMIHKDQEKVLRDPSTELNKHLLRNVLQIMMIVNKKLENTRKMKTKSILRMRKRDLEFYLQT